MEYKSGINTYNTNSVRELSGGRFEFSVWAPYAQEVFVEIRSPKYKVRNDETNLPDEWAKIWHVEAKTDDGKSFILPLKKDEDGVFKGVAPRGKVLWGYMYRFILKKNIDGQDVFQFRKDPRAICQPHIYSWSKIYNNKRYIWSRNERKWQAGKIKERLSVANPELMQLCNFAFVEAHIPTATKEGTIEAFKKRVDEFAQQGFQGILLMPAEGTYDLNWGYDGVDKYAVTRAWGKNLVNENVENADKINDALKELVDYCHKKKLNVGIDWVPSHITEEFGNVLADFGPYENVNKNENSCAKTWGGFTFNLEGIKTSNSRKAESVSADVKQVRHYIVDLPLHLIESYHFDFIRGDQSPNMFSNITMKLIKAEVSYYFPDVAVTWEDHRVDEFLTEPLSSSEVDNTSFVSHLSSVENILNNKTTLRHIGGDEIWDFNFSHALEANILDKVIYPAYPNVEFLAKFFDPHYKGTKFLLSHDEIGNHCGSRILIKYVASKLKLANNIETINRNLCKPSECAKKLIELYAYRKSLYLNDLSHINQILEFYFIKKNTVPLEQLEKAVKEAFAFSRLGHGCVYLASGSKMIFQGENYGEINPFLFHRVQPVDEVGITCCKGYDIGRMAFERSKLEPEYHFDAGIYNYFKELNKLCAQEAFLTDGKFNVKYVHNIDKTLVFERIRRKEGRQEQLLALMNYSTTQKSVECCVNTFGNELFAEVINSDNVIFGGGSEGAKDLKIEHNYLTTKIPPATLLVFKSK